MQSPRLAPAESPRLAPAAFTRAELEAVAEGLAILIAENPDNDPAQRAMRKVRDEIRRRSR
jgi:hypothetical protein